MPTYYVYEEGAGWVTTTSAGIGSSPLTTKGDLYGYDTADARIPVGTDGDVLTADSTQALGLKWAAAAAAGVSSLDSITGAVTLVAGSNVTITDNSPGAGDITIAASGSGSGYTIADYAQFTSAVTVSATTIGTAQTIVTGAGFTADGTSYYLVEFYSPSARAGTSNGDALYVNLFESTTDLGLLALAGSPGGYSNQPFSASMRVQPASGTRTYTIKSWINGSASNGVIQAGAGGSSTTFVPGYIMVTKLA